MIIADLPANETERLTALHQCHILDTLPEADYDDLVFLAAQICEAPIALISLVDAERQWFKARFGIEATETARDDAFCAHAILHPDEVLIVPDATEDIRFHDNPLVKGDPGIRFYAGAPIVVTTPAGFHEELEQLDSSEVKAVLGPGGMLALGTVCVIGDSPRTLSESQLHALRALARQVGNLLDLRLRRLLNERTTRRLEESERRMNDAQEVAQIGSWEYDIHSGKITWSREMFRLLGFDPANGEPDYETLLNRYHPEDIPMHRAIVERAIAEGETYAFDIRALSPDGSLRWMHSTGRPLFDEQGHVCRLLGTVQDITQRRITQDALSEMADNLQRSNAALHEFTSVASHDLKEPLRKVTMFARILEQEIQASNQTLSSEATYALSRITGSAKRMQNLIDGLLNLAKVSQQGNRSRYQWVNLHEVAEDVIADLDARIQETGGQVFLESLPRVFAEPLQMRQLLQNLIGNALKYHRRDVPPVVEVRRIDTGDSQCVTFSVADNGIGFAPEDAERVFGAFERLESGYEGSGVGLTICRRIIEGHGGAIHAEGQPGEGATFTVRLPVQQTDLRSRISGL